MNGMALKTRKRVHRWLLILVMTGTVNGVAGGTDTQIISGPAALNGTPAVNGASASDGTAAEVRENLTLEACLIAARQNSPDLLTRRENVAVADAEIAVAEAEKGPTVSLSASGNYVSVVPELMQPEQTLDTPLGPITVPGSHRRMGDEDHWEAAVTVNHVLYAGGRIRGGADLARTRRDASAAELPVVRQTVDRQTANLYLDLVRLTALKELAEVRLETARTHAAQVEDMVNAGVFTDNERLKAALRVSEAEETLIACGNGIRSVLDGLARLTGRRWDVPDGSLKPRRPNPHMMTDLPTPDTAIAIARVHRPELHHLEVLRSALMRQRCLIHRENLPVITGYGKAAFGKPGPDFIANDWIDYYEAGLQVRMNLWDNGRVKYRTARITCELNRLRKEEAARAAQIELEVRRARVQIQDAAARLDVAERSVIQAGENYRITQDQFEAGVLTHTDYLDAETLLHQSRTNRVVLRTELDRAWIHLYLAMGLDLLEGGIQ